MLRLNNNDLNHLESQYPGIVKFIHYFEEAKLPVCLHCGSKDTAKVNCGITGRTIAIGAATTKFKLLANGILGEYYCNSCEKLFN